VFDKLIISIGRVPNTTGLGAATVGLKLDERCALGLANAGRHEEQRRGDAEYR